MPDSTSGRVDASRARSRSDPSRRELLAALLSTAGAGSVLAGRSRADTDGTALTAFGAGDDRIRDEVWVETSVDTDDSGEPDRVFVRVSRPASTADGERVPVIATASPYFGEQTHSDATREMYYDRRVELSASGGGEAAAGDTDATDERSSVGTEPRHGPSRTAESPGARLERRYLPQGYAVALVSSLGTHRSTGCYTAAGPPTVEALGHVVDWFGGRATAYDSETGGDTVDADWSTGKTGMIGTSANGELANGVATTGVDGLEAVVPQAANAGHYSLFRANGTPISVTPDRTEGMADLGTWVQAGNARRPDCGHWTDRVEAGQDRATGDYNDFWHEREFLPDAGDVEAAVLLTHPVDDPIVKPNHVAEWYDRLDEHDVPLKLWLHEGGHSAPHGQTWDRLLDRWWAHWLKGADNGVMDEDPVSVVHGGQSAERGTLETYESWPVPGTEAVPVRFTPGGASTGGVAVADAGASAASVTESLVDDPSTPVSDLATVGASDHRLRYETPPLETRVHVSGQVVPTLAMSFDDPSVVSVALVEYDSAGSTVVTRGWADPQNRPAYGDYDSPVAYKQSLRESRPLDAGQQVTVEFPLQATDHVFEAGVRIGVVVYSSDAAFTLYPPGASTLTLSLAQSRVDLPVVGGRTALADALGADSDGVAPGSTVTDGRPGGTEPTDDDRLETGSASAGDSPTDTTSEGGPGLGVGAALAGLGGAGYLLGRRRADERTGSED